MGLISFALLFLIFLIDYMYLRRATTVGIILRHLPIPSAGTGSLERMGH